MPVAAQVEACHTRHTCLGRSKWLLEMREQRQYERRNEMIAARQALEQQFTAADEDEGGSGGGSGSGGGNRLG